jgi:hypothetical protein
MGWYRKQKPTESDAEYELYREARRLEYNAYKKAYREANQDKEKIYFEANKDRKKVYDIKRRYGLTTDEYNALIGRGCEICGSTEKLCVDHCHETLKVRGCLCNDCNLALGHYEKTILPNLDKFNKYLGGTL